MQSNAPRINNIGDFQGSSNSKIHDACKAVQFCSLCVYALFLAALLSLSLSGCGLTAGPNGSVTGPGALTITTSSLSSARVQSSYSASLAASGGQSPYTWSISSGSLPAGLSLASSTGKISGTPTQTGNFTFTAKVVDSSSSPKNATHSLTLNVSSGSTPPPPSTLVISTTSLPSGQVSVPYSVILTASNGQAPYTWGITQDSGPFPPGLTLAATTGTISGTPTTKDVYSFTIQVTDSSSPKQVATRTYGMTTLGVALDQYGGRMDINCASVTPYFHLEKISSRWYFCDPLGHGFISMSVGGVGPATSNSTDCSNPPVNVYSAWTSKYGDLCNGSPCLGSNWGWQTLKRMTTWGFNSIGQDSTGWVLPGQFCTNCSWPSGTQPIPLPYLTEDKPAEYASINKLGYLTDPIKDEIAGTNTNYSSWRGGALYDVYDPKLNTEWQDELNNNSNSAIRTNNPYLLGVFTDDSDYFWGSGAGPDFPTGHTNSNIAWVTLITSPVQTYIPSTAFCCGTFLYQAIQNYTKSQALNPTTACSVANPCSLRDYLWQKYKGSISALNTAWGSNYTSFDSTGTQVTAEKIGTGDGSTRVFTHALADTSISPYSVLISVAGTAAIGDCPWFRTLTMPSSGCGTSTANTGTLASPTTNYVTQSASSINYSTGSVTITFVNAPAAGVSITASYIHGGWMAGGTGLMDEDGSHTAWVGTNPFCLEGADPNYPAFFTCTGGSGQFLSLPNANPTLGLDLDNWIPEFSAKYFKTMHDDLKAVSNLPYLGLDVFGSWGGPPYSKFMQGATPYLDGAFFNLKLWLLQPTPVAFQSAYQYTTQYIGDLPLLNFAGIYAQSDSSMSCHPDTGDLNSFATQDLRGQNWFNMVSYVMSTPGHNGDIPFVGFDFWSWVDFQNLNQGLVSIHDNAYDGHEAVSGTVTCSAPLQTLSCGGESANYGDAITQIRAANLYWILH